MRRNRRARGFATFRMRPDSVSIQATFSRASTATYHDASGIVGTAASGVLRDAHYTVPLTGSPERTVLYEPARTNGWTHSQDFTQSAWSKSQATVTADAASAPDGTTTAGKLVDDSTSGTTHAISRALPATVDNGTPSFSIYAKAGERTWIMVQSLTKAGATANSFFDLGGGVLGSVSAAHTSRIIPLANGWYRCTVTFSVGTGVTTPSVTVFMSTGGTSGDATYDGDGASGLYLWGAQAEVSGFYPTSYIPTTGSTAQRHADNISAWPASWPSRETSHYERYIDLATRLVTDSVAVTSTTSPALPTSGRAYTHIYESNGTVAIALMRQRAGV